MRSSYGTTLPNRQKQETLLDVPLVSHGDMVITPVVARRIVTECWFEGQEGRMKRGRLHIMRYVEIINRGQWRNSSQLHFAKLQDGKLLLVDGYHRLNAIAESGRTVGVNVAITDCDDLDDVEQLYASFDRPGETRIRTNAQALNAVDLATRLGVQKKVSEAAFKAILVVKNEMRVPTRADAERLLPLTIFDVRCHETVLYSTEIRMIDAALNKSPTRIKTKLLGVSNMAMMLVTFRNAREKAEVFWRRVATNDGLRKGTPENTLVVSLLDKQFSGLTDDAIIAASLAWNAFYEGRPLSKLSLNALKHFYIAGTPFSRTLEKDER